jgi:hypothetical protein
VATFQQQEMLSEKLGCVKNSPHISGASDIGKEKFKNNAKVHSSTSIIIHTIFPLGCGKF